MNRMLLALYGVFYVSHPCLLAQNVRYFWTGRIQIGYESCRFKMSEYMTYKTSVIIRFPLDKSLLCEN